jgi:hypothetical protein
MNTTLRIDPEFESLCPALTDEEYTQLKENILAEGEVLTPIIVWDGTIIDGHNRWKILQEHPNIKYGIRKKWFSNRHEAVAWICSNQLGRRNLTPRDKEYLVGKRYEAEKLAHGGNRKSDCSKSTDKVCPLISEGTHTTRERIAKEVGASEGYVMYAEQFARGIDVAENIALGIKHEILGGTIKPTKKEVIAIAKARPEERLQKVDELRSPKKRTQSKESREKSRQAREDIQNIYADMKAVPVPIGEDSILETLEGAVADMIHVCDTLFLDFPRLLEDHDNKAKVIQIMQAAKQYVLQIESDDTVSRSSKQA